MSNPNSPSDMESHPNKVLKSDSTRSLAVEENKYQIEGSRKSERPGLDIFTRVAGLFRELFEEGRLMWRQCSFCCTRARGCLPLGTQSVCVVCVCVRARVPAYVCLFQKGCTEPQPGAIPDYPSLSFNTPACVCVCAHTCVCVCVCVWHTCKHTPTDTHMQNILRRPSSVDPSRSMNGF